MRIGSHHSGSSLVGLPRQRRNFEHDDSSVPRIDASGERSGSARNMRFTAEQVASLAGNDPLSLTVDPRNRSAVASYLLNQPTIYERLGIELAGVDLYV